MDEKLAKEVRDGKGFRTLEQEWLAKGYLEGLEDGRKEGQEQTEESK